MPGTFVIKLFLDGNKALRAGDVAPEDDNEPEPDPLDLALSPGLPEERRLELLTLEREKATARLATIDEALENLGHP